VFGVPSNVLQTGKLDSRPIWRAIALVWSRGVLEFLGDEEAGDLRAGAVLSDEVYVL
jgi:hypothetical protein